MGLVLTHYCKPEFINIHEICKCNKIKCTNERCDISEIGIQEKKYIKIEADKNFIIYVNIMKLSLLMSVFIIKNKNSKN